MLLTFAWIERGYGHPEHLFTNPSSTTNIQKCDTARAQCDGYKASSLHLVTVMEHDDS
jgi:hypothetical protein